MTEEATALAAELGANPTGQAVRLTGGNLNHVFRVPTDVGSVILKVAPDHVATVPSIRLDPGRLDHEVEVLRAVPQGGGVRVPEVLAHDPQQHAALLEDVGDLPDLAAFLESGGDPKRLVALGAWLALLHSHRKAFPNPSVQQTRFQVQYSQVGAWLEAAGLPNPDAAANARDLGERLLEQGRCWIMGDLWPASILVDHHDFVVIDWELSHVGVPAQDIGHLAAHLWMLEHRRGIPSAMASFFAGYHRTLTAYDWQDLNWHAGAEILARTLGPFAKGYLYDGLEPDHPAMREAIAEGLRLLA